MTMNIYKSYMILDKIFYPRLIIILKVPPRNRFSWLIWKSEFLIFKIHFKTFNTIHVLKLIKELFFLLIWNCIFICLFLNPQILCCWGLDIICVFLEIR